MLFRSEAMVVTSDARATQSALEVLQEGGNAIDALVAAQAVLNVVEPQASGLGGAGFLLFYDVGTRRVLFFDGSAQAPSRMRRDTFLQHEDLSSYKKLKTSGLAIGIPGTLKLLWEVHSRYRSGKFSFSKLLDPAITFAEQGATVSEPLAQALKRNIAELAISPYFRDIFFNRGILVKSGASVTQTDLADTFRLIQEKGVDVFYSGEVSKAIIKKFQKEPGDLKLLRRNDLKKYHVVKGGPLFGEYKEYGLFTAGPPSAGGVTLLAACNILSNFSVESFAGKAEAIFLVNEALKLSSRISRAIGDPDIFELPIEKALSAEWTRKQVNKIHFEKAYNMPAAPGDLDEEGKARLGSSILILDKNGNMIAYTGTLGDPFGSAMMVPGHGFFLNDLLLDFDRFPSMLKNPDEPNTPGPNRRPKSFFAPLFVFKGSKPIFIMNVQGGRDSSAIALNMLIQFANFKVPCEELVDVARVVNRGGIALMEQEIYNQGLWRVQLEMWGQKVEMEGSFGNGQTVCFANDSGKIIGRTDPRKEYKFETNPSEGAAAGY